jgi:hypothetical protein
MHAYCLEGTHRAARPAKIYRQDSWPYDIADVGSGL